MQEVTVAQRSIFTHSVIIDSPGKELCWNFFTRKKNIYFGLSKQEPGKSQLLTVASNPNVTKASSTLGGSNTLQIPSSMSHYDSSSSLSSLDRGSIAIRKSINLHQDLQDLTVILPMAHYESSKMAIKGSYFVQEPGTYVLIFDNTFSSHTPKKLFFFVALRDVEPKEIVNRKELEGWLLKKGNRSIQGYQKRWAEVQTSGIMTYYKGPGRTAHGSINLVSSAIRLDHDHLLIDIDSEQMTYHFKVESKHDFSRWTALLELFSTFPKGNFGMGGDNSTSFSIHSINNIDGAQNKTNQLVTNMTRDLLQMHDLLEQNNTLKLEKKELLLLQRKIFDMSKSMVQHQSALQEQYSLLENTIQNYRDKTNQTIQALETGFYSCFNDNNRFRKKYGLELVSIGNYLPNADMTDSTSMLSSRQDEEFFDAEGQSDISSENFSLHDALENATIIDDDSDAASFNSDIQMNNAEEIIVEEVLAGESLKPISSRSTLSRPFIRRTTLPCPAASMENISIVGILRNNVGKDLSTVAMPIALNEPINLLQKLCEELEYSSLLDQASLISEPVERLTIVAAFVVSGYSSSIYRSARKPFNPLLGESYECDRPDKGSLILIVGFRYISEKVSHHPAIMACHASSQNYEFYQDSLLKTKFWGKSMELNNVGTVHLKFPASNEHYIWSKLTTSMRNMFSSTRYLEHHGTIKITSKTTGHYCELTFKESGYFASSNNEVLGGVFSPFGKKEISLGGRWDQSISSYKDSNPNNLNVLWRANGFPPNHADNYSFTQFAIELNELTPDLQGKLPITDTRYRTDQQMYEIGKTEEAELEKQRLEQKQRETRKIMESKGLKHSPKYFELVKDPDSPSGSSWRYKGGYWEQRGNFANEIDLFS